VWGGAAARVYKSTWGFNVETHWAYWHMATPLLGASRGSAWNGLYSDHLHGTGFYSDHPEHGTGFYSDHPEPAASESGAVSCKVVKLITALEAAGNACSMFAVPHCCNNPGCSNLAGASEHSIVSGRSCICGGCQAARYCGRACQRADWKQHKPVCKMLQGAAAQHS
jgi:hypothetical protein